MKQIPFGLGISSLEIRPSQKIIGQQGLYCSNNLGKNTIFAWYLGHVFENDEKLKSHTDTHRQGDRYVFRVPKWDNIKNRFSKNDLYFIDALDQDSKTKTCAAAYMNHSQKYANVEYRYMYHPDADFQVGVAFVALTDIPKDTELFFDYGDDYHKDLVKSGYLVE
jgi:hypothetical protein